VFLVGYFLICLSAPSARKISLERGQRFQQQGGEEGEGSIHLSALFVLQEADGA
jgi:hypothetical protein